MDRFKPKSTFATSIDIFNKSMYLVSVSAEEATAAFVKLTKEFMKIRTKEYIEMENKLLLLETRLHTLEGRHTECEAIRKKLRRQIRNLKAKMAETLVA